MVTAKRPTERTMDAKRGEEQDLGIVWERPRCRNCGSYRVLVQRTVQQGPPLIQWRRCEDCEQSFKSIGT